MPTHSLTSTLTWATDAGWRQCLQEIYDLVTATGMVATADTGQLDRFTASAPVYSASAVIGYMVFKTNDGYVDIYLKMIFAWGNSGVRYCIGCEVGPSTDGAGTVTGAVTINCSPINGDLVFTSALSRSGGTSGCYWIEYRPGTCSSLYPLTFFSIMRFCGPLGTPTDNGYVAYGQNKTTTLYCGQVIFDGFGGAVLNGSTFGYCAAPITVVGAMSDGDIQTWKHYTAQPRVRVNPFALTRDSGSIAEGLTRELTVASQIRTYIALHPGTYRGCAMSTLSAGGSTAAALMLPWM